MMADGFQESVLEAVDELREVIVGRARHDGRLHRAADFERDRFHTHRCDKCQHTIGPQQVAALKRLEQVEEIVEADTYAEVEEAVGEAGVEP